jgi:hypothetical protein
MGPERSLERLLADLRAGEYVFVSLPRDSPPGRMPAAGVREPEGTT